MEKKELWGRLYDRYQDPDRPHRMLALDGGGIRGVLTLEVLVKMEDLLAKATGKGDAFRLCNFFDYVAGTSTGAIIAAGIARGLSARDLLDFYKKTGPAMFDKASLLTRLRYQYESGSLERELKAKFGADSTLFPKDLECLFLAVTRNVTTDSAWPVSSNPEAKYNLPDRKDCNLCIPLWQLVRASTAAPIYFAPEVLRWDKDDPSKHFVFVDGGMTPYNNPAFLLYRMATNPAYKLGWKTGEKNLLLISVGTGAAPTLGLTAADPTQNVASNLVSIPGALMYGALVDQDINCRTVGRCVYGASIDRELGTMIPDEPESQDLGRAFRYARYNAELTSKALNAWGMGDIDPNAVAQLDSVAHIGDLSRIGQRLGDEIKIEHFGSFV
jgi:hypothetical protein